MANIIDEATVRRWWYTLKDYKAPVEIRIFLDGKTYSGYFTDCERMLEQLAQFEGAAIYATLNPCNQSCMDRVQGDKIMKIGKNPTTSGNDIAGREFIMIDIDPERSAGTNASDEEKAHARKVMMQVGAYLKQQGFQAPVVADSANGYHLYYKVHIGNTPEMTELIRNFLQVLSMYFSNEHAKIDTAVSDPNRIAKIIGTASAKGRNTASRPQRVSGFIRIPDELKTTDIAFVRKVAAELPSAPKADHSNNFRSEPFDIDSFIRDHNIQVRQPVGFHGGRKYILEECPFDPQHKAPDSALFVMDSGAIAFKCLHNSCSHYGWKDFRLHFDPNAYDRKDYGEFQKKRRSYTRERPVIVTEEAKGAKWLKPSDIKWVDPNSFPYIPTGIEGLDRVMLGLTMGDVTIVSGLAGSGKTSMIDFMILNAADRGFKVAAWSGELQDFRFMSWLDQMAAGKTNVQMQPGYENIYYAPKRYAEAINKWLDGKFWLYNNDYGNQWSQLIHDIQAVIDEQHPDLIVIDNLTALNLDTTGDDKLERQKSLINEVKDMAKRENVHVILVCHPRKEQSYHMLRMESISGSSDLVNLADNVLIVHRGGTDLHRRMTEFFSQIIADEYQKYDTVIEIAKNRSHGRVNTLIGMYFEPETRRLINNIGENIVYGWDDSHPRFTQEFEWGDMPDFDNQTE